jgi:hypothetical protein
MDIGYINQLVSSNFWLVLRPVIEYLILVVLAFGLTAFFIRFVFPVDT